MNPVNIVRLGDDDWQTLRDLRLAALETSPHAFWAVHQPGRALRRLSVTDGNDPARTMYQRLGFESPATGRRCHTMPPSANTG